MSFIKILSKLAKLKYFLLFLSLILIIPFMLFPIISSPHFPIISDAWSATYYVDATNGNDSNKGLSEVTPWQTIAKVNASRFYTGDQILFKKGEIWREQLVVPSSGSSGNPITFGAYGSGDKPIISGAQIFMGWTNKEGNIYKKTGVTTNTHIVVFDGILGTAQSDVASLSSDGDYYMDGDSNNLYIYSVIPPSGRRIEGAQRDYTIFVDGRSYITIGNFDLRNVNHSAVMFCNSASNNTVQNCTISNAYNNGITVYSFSCNLTIKNNTISYCGYREVTWKAGILIDAGATTNTTLEDNIISYSNCGVYIGDDSDGNTLTRITSHHNYYMGFNVVNSINNIFTDCLTYNNPGHPGDPLNYGGGFYIDGTESGGGSDNNNLIRCKSHNDYVGFTYTNYSTGGTMSYCIASDSEYAGFSVDTNIDGANIYNCVSANAGATDYWIVDNCTNVNIKNCIGYNTDKRVFTVDVNTIDGTFDFDHNCWYNTSGYLIQSGENSYSRTQFSAYQSTEGQDAHSIALDPRFVDTLNNNFTLQSTSKCIDTGISVGLIQDFSGTPVPQGDGVDIGAFEYREHRNPPAAPTGLKIQ
jgi:parallel beta-helix repeat protein